MGRPREFDTDQALESAMQVFWTRGFEGTSISDLMAATGLQKQSLYGAFGSKQEIYIAALKRYEETRLRQSEQILAGSGSVVERIGGLFDMVIDRACRQRDRSGCMLCNVAVDRASLCTDTQSAVDTCVARFLVAFDNALSASKLYARNKALRKKRARALLASYFGLNVLAKAGASQETLEDVRDSALETISSGG